jgi:hypothetical protein
VTSAIERAGLLSSAAAPSHAAACPIIPPADAVPAARFLREGCTQGGKEMLYTIIVIIIILLILGFIFGRGRF